MPPHLQEMLGLLDSGSDEECKASKLDVPRPTFIMQGVPASRDVVLTRWILIVYFLGLL